MNRPLMGRRQLIVGGSTFLAGMAAAAVWTSAHPPRPVVQTALEPASTTSLLASTTASAPTSTTTSTVAPTPQGSTTPTAAATTSPATGSPAVYVNHGPADRAAVALTFHLGGAPHLVGMLLDLLKAKNIHSTLFAIGDWLTANPELGHRAVGDGHELGNHTKSHKSMLQLSATQIHEEIVGGGEALIPFIGSIGKWFRPSGTDVPNDTILEQAGLVGYPFSVGYDVDSLDYTNPGSKAVINKVTKELHPGAIVSLHFGHQSTIDAMPAIVDLLTTASLQTVTVSELLGR